MALISFCGFLTLQVGAAILAAVFFTLAGVILAANVFDYHSSVDGWFPFSLVLMLIFVIGLIIAGILMFASSYSENRSSALMALIVIIILICYWIILCCFSFFSHKDQVNDVCIDKRCPESFWIGNLRYRRYHVNDKEPDEPIRRRRDAHFENLNSKRREDQAFQGPASEVDEWEENANELNLIGPETKGKRIDYIPIGEEDKKDRYVKVVAEDTLPLTTPDDPFTTPGPVAHGPRRGRYYHRQRNTTSLPKYVAQPDEEDEGASRYVFGAAMIGAILLFILNLLFLLFSAFVMYSWARELDYGDYYYDDDPVVIVEDY
ncbi:uncharacterized protein LOC128982622 [Macrosteles quadrilineatus]|uniref:uncharacterized protein LOC128982622 n=1 Tax=Macrosteles quadrilineatus TaxID=74068 RepID=UPI0023E29B90|nr:uncharacterized protein LOC128982622 [Macrosteles quadrilineatus]